MVHLCPNSFEKIRVVPALLISSEEALKGLFFYRKHIEKVFGCSASETEASITRMSKLIKIMTSHIPSAALKVDSPNVSFLKEFLDFLDEWETHAKDSKNAALQSHFTVNSGPCYLVDYLSTQCGFKHLLTSRLSQDKLENLFGIVRQYNGLNDHPTRVQFLATINALALYNFAKPNCSPEVVNSLLAHTSAETSHHQPIPIHALDLPLDEGKFDDVKEALTILPSEDHSDYITRHSSSRLVYCVAVCVARKAENWA